MGDERFNALGKRIWLRVVRITSFTETQHLKVFGADCRKERDQELLKLWGDLQTLFRGGVFSEDIPPYDTDEETEAPDGTP